MNSTQMSAPAIEAKSLSSLTALASNPPAYPRNPTHVKHEPLVLYIARVPGSKDVFLSPMKPRDKVVTAEDIQSSLYFVHVDHPEDVNLVAKPDFGTPSYPEQRRLSPVQPSPIVTRKAVPGGPADLGVSATPMRIPVPGPLTPINNFDSRENASAGDYSKRHGQSTPGYSPRRSFDSNQSYYENQRPILASRRPSEIPRQLVTSLTLIRRDPASGAQWNVAQIVDPPGLEVSSSSGHDAVKRKSGAPMYIEILNPGYSKFLHTETAAKPSFMIPNSNMSVRSQQAQELYQHSSPEPQSPAPFTLTDNVFRRRVWMEGVQHAGNGFGHRKKNSYDYSTPRADPKGSVGGLVERFPIDPDSQPSPSILTRNEQTYSTIQATDRQTSFRGYVFTSPWSGRCEFTTGTGGGSLKCRHIIPGLQGASPAAMTVSELRFNLPSRSRAAISRAEEPSKRSSFFNRTRHTRNNSTMSLSQDDNVDEARGSLDRLDLSLGQELAGGGFGGKQAKLGKIVIEDEGLKMMDLLVAANIGLWWRAYEKASAVV